MYSGIAISVPWADSTTKSPLRRPSSVSMETSEDSRPTLAEMMKSLVSGMLWDSRPKSSTLWSRKRTSIIARASTWSLPTTTSSVTLRSLGCFIPRMRGRYSAGFGGSVIGNARRLPLHKAYLLT